MPKTGPAVQLRLAGELVPSPENARLHDDEQIELLIRSFDEFGYTNPILADAKGIVAGHGRQTAVLRLYERGGSLHLPNGEPIPGGMVPVLDVSGWSPERRRAYLLADNALTLRGEWDETKLLAELEALQAADFPIDLIGFDEAELARLFNPASPGLTDPDDVPDEPENPVTRRDDVWCCGPHRIKCGDATCAEDVESVLNGMLPHLLVSDPPYGVEYDASWRNDAGPGVNGTTQRVSSGKAKSQNTAGRAVGKVLNDDRADWGDAWALFPGDVAYVWHDPNRSHLSAASLIAAGFEIRVQIIWNKSSLVIGRGHYHPKHEPLWYAVRCGKTAHWQGDKKQVTVWDIDKPMKSETGHSTQKPVECMKRPIENNSKAGDYIYDPFLGSGTTAIAAEMTGRKCLALELNPAYVDLSIERWAAFSGGTPILEATGQTFAEVKAEREAAVEAA